MPKKQPRKLVPSRGTVEDWAPKNEAALLRKKEKYGKKMARQDTEAQPDFEELLKDDLKDSS